MGWLNRLIYKRPFDDLLSRYTKEPVRSTDLSEKELLSLAAYGAFSPSERNGMNEMNDARFLIASKTNTDATPAQKVMAELLYKRADSFLKSAAGNAIDCRL